MDNLNASAGNALLFVVGRAEIFHCGRESVALTIHGSLKQSRASRRKEQQARDAELETERIQQRMEMRINELVGGAAATSPPSNRL
jgi:hypothetical protein